MSEWENKNDQTWLKTIEKQKREMSEFVSNARKIWRISSIFFVIEWNDFFGSWVNEDAEWSDLMVFMSFAPFDY